MFKKSKNKISFLLLLGFILNLYGLATMIHEGAHTIQSSLGFAHFHIHQDGVEHSHEHKHDSKTSEKHDHEVEENETLAIAAKNSRDLSSDFLIFKSFYQKIDFSYLNSNHSFLVFSNQFFKYKVLDDYYFIPHKMAPPKLV
jgi:hypothetical protein